MVIWLLQQSRKNNTFAHLQTGIASGRPFLHLHGCNQHLTSLKNPPMARRAWRIFNGWRSSYRRGQEHPQCFMDTSVATENRQPTGVMPVLFGGDAQLAGRCWQLLFFSQKPGFTAFDSKALGRCALCLAIRLWVLLGEWQRSKAAASQWGHGSRLIHEWGSHDPCVCLGRAKLPRFYANCQLCCSCKSQNPRKGRESSRESICEIQLPQNFRKSETPQQMQSLPKLCESWKESRCPRESQNLGRERSTKVAAKKYLRVNRKVKRVLGTADIGLARK